MKTVRAFVSWVVLVAMGCVPQPVVVPEPQPAPQPVVVQTPPQPQQVVVAQPEPQPAPQPVVVAEPQPEPQPAAQPEPQPPAPEPQPQPAPQPPAPAPQPQPPAPPEMHDSPIATTSGGPFYGLYPGKPGLALERKYFFPGQVIKLRFTAPGYYNSSAWIGIVPSNVPHGEERINDQYDITYKYLNRATSGEFTFTAPYKPGYYDFRLNDTDSNGREVASLSFVVFENKVTDNPQPPPPPWYQRPKIVLDKQYYQPGEPIRVSYTAYADFHGNAWLGIVPSRLPHGDEKLIDQYDLAYKYLNKTTSGQFTFTAPSKPGYYDFRMTDRDSNGREVSYVSFVVFETALVPNPTPAPPSSYRRPSLVLNKTVFHPGEEIVVQYTAYPHYPNSAWIGIVPSNVPHGEEKINDQYDLAYRYIGNAKYSGTMTFRAPREPGQYDLRFNDSDSNGREVAYVTFQVVP